MLCPLLFLYTLLHARVQSLHLPVVVGHNVFSSHRPTDRPTADSPVAGVPLSAPPLHWISALTTAESALALAQAPMVELDRLKLEAQAASDALYSLKVQVCSPQFNCTSCPFTLDS